MKQIAFFQTDLRVGGVQKSLVNILNDIDFSRCCVDVYASAFSTCPPMRTSTLNTSPPRPASSG